MSRPWNRGAVCVVRSSYVIVSAEAASTQACRPGPRRNARRVGSAANAPSSAEIWRPSAVRPSA
ncbi:hypothetical protein [Streptomyces sp. Agncl-13]|uniref:hypothetical protein n=1 Tax=Streptomyces sp. Agncl-13 TaxID=3400628 RepID=UPI003A8AC371